MPRSTLSNFNPRSPCGERPYATNFGGFRDKIFQSTLPVRGATLRRNISYEYLTDFNPRSPCGERLIGLPKTFIYAVISIHAPRAGSDHDVLYLYAVYAISIHAPRAGSDKGAVNPLVSEYNISIHAPRAGSDIFNSPESSFKHRFQSTLPVRGATQHGIHHPQSS